MRAHAASGAHDERPPLPSSPTLAESWEVAGYDLGVFGVAAEVSDVFPDATERDLVVAGFVYSDGQHKGLKRHARALGFGRGLENFPCDRLAGVASRFAFDFELGWSEGAAEMEVRARILEAEWLAEQAEAAEAERRHDLEHLTRLPRGWAAVVVLA